MANTPVTSIRLPDDLKEWLDAKAAEQNRSRANLIITILRDIRAADKKGRK